MFLVRSAHNFCRPYAPRHTRRKTIRHGLDYKTSGVDIDAGAELVRRIRKLNPDIGGFNGLVPFGDKYLVAGTDGVGTKLKLAFEMKKHDTIGIDLVAMSVNDILTSGADPLFFLDYYATGKLDVDVAEQVVKGIVEGCQQSGCILLGGETAEMPGFYATGEYDVAGFAVGSVSKTELIDGKRDIQQGDVLIGLPSNGVHSNGFSLVRKVLEVSGTSLIDKMEWNSKRTIGELLLEPTVIYLEQIKELMKHIKIKGMVHITGGGFPENLPRMLPEGLACQIHHKSWIIPELFKWIQKNGSIKEEEMFRTFNMGIGMVLAIDPNDLSTALELNTNCRHIGTIIKGTGVVFD